jgi:hypothetical protein
MCKYSRVCTGNCNNCIKPLNETDEEYYGQRHDIFDGTDAKGNETVQLPIDDYGEYAINDLTQCFNR